MDFKWLLRNNKLRKNCWPFACFREKKLLEGREHHLAPGYKLPGGEGAGRAACCTPLCVPLVLGGPARTLYMFTLSQRPANHLLSLWHPRPLLPPSLSRMAYTSTSQCVCRPQPHGTPAYTSGINSGHFLVVLSPVNLIIRPAGKCRMAG